MKLRSPLERFAHRWWGGSLGAAGSVLSLLTLPAGALFGAAVHARNAAYDRGWRTIDGATIPVLSVGNLSVGGTGKTPVTGWLAATIRARGGRPAIVSRGYGADELALHRAWNPSVPLYSAPDRAEGIRRAGADGATVALLDDGFQHRRAGRDMDLVLVAAEQPWPPRLLPRGPYREPLSSLRRADHVLLTRKHASPGEADRLEERLRRLAPALSIVRVHLAPSGWRALDGGEARRPVGAVLAVTSIAGPDTFFAMVHRELDDAVEGHAFPDHHVYTAGDVARIAKMARGRAIVTTEKDAVKLVHFASRLPPVHVLCLRVVIERGEAVLLDALDRLGAGGR